MPINRLNYLNFSDELYYLQKETNMEEVLGFSKSMMHFQDYHKFFQDRLFFIIDYKKRKYITMAGAVEAISGFHSKDFLYGGLDFVVEMFQKDDFSIFSMWKNLN